MRASLTSIVATLCLPVSHSADADFVFDFSTADRTFLGGGPLDPAPTPVPGPGDFVPVPGPTFFLVGNLTNSCGLFPPRDPRQGVGLSCPAMPELTNRIDYDTGADTFTLTQDTELLLQVIVKLGHPEAPLGDKLRDQNQLEQFDIFLKDPSSLVTLELAQLLDDVNENDGEVPNGYYRYVYQPMVVAAGTWFPSFEARDGSIEFLTQLSRVPEPGTMSLFGPGLAGLALVWWRRRRTS